MDDYTPNPRFLTRDLYGVVDFESDLMEARWEEEREAAIAAERGDDNDETTTS